jgi:hypothetical protein
VARFLVGDPAHGIQLGVCARCRKKVFLYTLTPDPNAPGLYVCDNRSCVDRFDPYRLPRRLPEQITGPITRPDQPIDTTPTGPVPVLYPRD